MHYQECGCEMTRRGRNHADPELRELLVRDGAEASHAWRCPAVGWPAPDDNTRTDHFTKDHEHTLKAVERLTGFPAACAKTCPVWYAGLPWVHRATELWNWREKNSVQLVTLKITRPIQAAIDAVDRGVTAKAEADAKLARDRAERDAEWEAAKHRRYTDD